jgi:hypothetical protein
MSAPTFPIGFDGGKLRSGLVFGGKYFGGETGGFCRGFCDFMVFCDGKSVVSLWWNAW